MRSEEAFTRVAREFEAKRRVRSADSASLTCMPWLPSFPPLAHFPCCHNWTICEPRTPLLRQRTGYIVRANETPANGSHRVPSDSTLR